MLKKLKAIWDLTRLEHGIIYAVSLLVSLTIAYHSLPTDPGLVIAGVIAVVTAEMGAFALNDYFDVEVDRKNNRTDRPIIRGDISRKEALLLTIVAFIVSVVAGYFMGNVGALAVLVALIAFGILYDYKLKEYGVLGNVYIAFTMAAPFLFSSMLFKGSTVLLVLSVIAFLVGLGREIMKGIMDVEGDALRDVKTVARVYGANAAKYTAVALYLIALLFAPVPFIVDIDPAFYRNLYYAIPAAIATLVLLWICADLLKSHDRKAISRARKTTLLGMLIALVAFLAGALT
ncbi:MAG: Digeranylgeranylglyceryl phosphate synthase [Methanocella sp. PtaU1.Bin125]|nr:MAG: Digeranylgeranylglyceryl phosphate synthase [Methanocella sp. PtaU1.Bin125]